jgi:hypothetical protein
VRRPLRMTPPWQIRQCACRVPKFAPGVIRPPEAGHAGAARAAFLSGLLSCVACSASQARVPFRRPAIALETETSLHEALFVSALNRNLPP